MIAPTNIQQTFDAVLLHVYWPSRVHNTDGKDTFKGGLRNRLAVRAASNVYWHSPARPKIVIAGAKLKGPSYPSFSHISKTELIGKYNIPEVDIITTEEAHNTDGEVAAFLRIAREHGWKNVASIGWGVHTSARRLLAIHMPPDIHSTFLPISEVLEMYDTDPINRLVKRFEHSRYEVGFWCYEGIKTVLVHIPLIQKRMYSAREARQATNDDNRIIELLMHSIDTFKS